MARLPAPADNVAIAVRRLEPGTAVLLDSRACTLAHTVLEGHRFAVRAIAPGEPLLSWGLPFGHALTAIRPGEYIANESILAALSVRAVDARLPVAPNFADRLEPFRLDEAAIPPAPPVEHVANPRTFQGYRRPGRRGVGTRNCIVILGTTSRTAAYARQLAARLQPLARGNPEFDGIVAVAHTEGGGMAEPNNATEVLRALAGFMVHPNVGAVLVVDYGVEPITNARLRAFLTRHDYPLADVPHEFLSITGSLAAALTAGEAAVHRWMPTVAAERRTTQPLSTLRVALQCGGSDAFSGVSGNPLVGAVAHEVIRHGGSACLCETDEAFGAESYLVQNIRDAPTARALVTTLDRFRQRLGWHGVTAESNPSGGNKLRGLYNISLKSLGAVHKKDPRTRLDRVLNYGELITEPGFYFMDSPGNDLEGIAGQVAAGCTLFLFVTGNGSVTNFPFAPTIKVTTTTRRHQLLVNEMDVNAGRYLDGEPMDALAAETFDLLCATASGQRTKGERAGHSQVSLWRDWRQTDTAQFMRLLARPAPDGHPLTLVPAPGEKSVRISYSATRLSGGWAAEPVCLVVPTSMCSSQIACLAAARMNERGVGRGAGVSRFVALPHTEGCGFGGESMYALLHRTYRGYALHPNAVASLFLEHGCEKTPNDVIRREIVTGGDDPDRFGWVSVQLDGGISRSLDKIEAWFAGRLGALPPPVRSEGDFGTLRLGLMSGTPVGAVTAAAFAAVGRAVVTAGGSVLLPENDPLLANDAFRTPLTGAGTLRATLAYGEPVAWPGLHLVATETDHWIENLTGLGACGSQVFLTLPGEIAQSGHPFLPVLQFSEVTARPASRNDFDAALRGDAMEREAILLNLLAAALEGRTAKAAGPDRLTDFQLTRGLLGVSA